MKVNDFRFRAAGAGLLGLAGVLCSLTAAVAEPLVNLYYEPITGNLTLQNTSPGPVSLSLYQILTLGDGTEGPASSSGQGYLSGTSARVPQPPPSFVTSNTDSGGVNGLSSEIFVNNGGAAFLTLAPHASWSVANPIGPAGSYFDLGNVAATGMTQADLNERFITVADLSPEGVSLGGSFLFDYDGTSATSLSPGSVVALVPEPSMLMLLGSAAGFGAMRLVRSGVRRLPRWATDAEYPARIPQR